MTLNKKLQQALEKEFRPLGIVAYSCCCRLGCTGTYEEDDDFECREKGIYFFRLHLEGMNYDPTPESFYVQYDDFEYLMKNWDAECALIKRWAEIVGVKIREIKKPDSENIGIGVFFTEPLKLQDPLPSSEPENDDDPGNKAFKAFMKQLELLQEPEPDLKSFDPYKPFDFDNKIDF